MTELEYGDKSWRRVVTELSVPAMGPEVSQDGHKCQICGKAFSRKDNLSRHFRVHGERDDFQCALCGHVFTREGNLIAHERSHERSTHSHSVESSGDQIICDKCGKQCKTKKALNDHMITHTKKYVCDVCNARFAQRYKLERHIASHNQEKQKYPKCSENFMQLKEHMQRGKCTSEGGKAIFTCTSCNRSFKEKRYLNQHNRNVHNNTFYECQHRMAIFRHRSTRLRHIRKEHPE